jgi:hypothetical protein
MRVPGVPGGLTSATLALALSPEARPGAAGLPVVASSNGVAKANGVAKETPAPAAGAAAPGETRPGLVARPTDAVPRVAARGGRPEPRARRA